MLAESQAEANALRTELEQTKLRLQIATSKAEDAADGASTRGDREGGTGVGSDFFEGPFMDGSPQLPGDTPEDTDPGFIPPPDVPRDVFEFSAGQRAQPEMA